MQIWRGLPGCLMGNRINSPPELTAFPQPPRRVSPIDSHNLALEAAAAALDKKAFDLALLDVTKIVSYAEYVLVCSGSSDRQLAAVAQAIVKKMQDAGVKSKGVEGIDSGRWVLIDFGDVVVHVFLEPVRHLYDLEGLFHMAGQVEIPGYDRKRDQSYAQQFG
jgi:ribosome-associated protein